MIRGHIDVVTSSGYVEGWACDVNAPYRPLALCIVAEGQEVARGVANRYRADLVEAKVGTGWCAFRFRTYGPVGRLRRVSLSMFALSGNYEIPHESAPILIEDSDLQITLIEEIVNSDPTLINSVEQLRGCNDIFAALIKSAGVEMFVRAAYIYLLGRPADASGLSLYGQMIVDDKLTPFGLLEALSDSDEFHTVPRILIAPTEPGFIFSAL